jgi:hypothetical protein
MVWCRLVGISPSLPGVGFDVAGKTCSRSPSGEACLSLGE